MFIHSETIEPQNKINNSACGCGSGGCGCHSSANVEGVDLTGLPDRFQLVAPGDRVVDLGSGTGQDCLDMSRLVGPTGKVTGIEYSEENLNTSLRNLDASGIVNVEFRKGDLTDIPLPDEYADVIYASCVFSLQLNRQKAADEMYRVAKHNGYVCVSDFVVLEPVPEALRKEASAFAGCMGAAEQVNDFMNYFKKTGFEKGGIVEVNKVKLPDEILEKYLDAEMIRKYNDINSDEGIFSVVLVVEKPATCNAETCCHNPEKHKNQA